MPRFVVSIALAGSLLFTGANATHGNQRSAAGTQALYQANWQTRTTGWVAGGGTWTARAGLLTNRGSDSSSFLAPYQVIRTAYALEAVIRLSAWRHSGESENNAFGLLFRAAGAGTSSSSTGLVGGVARGFLGCDGLFSWAGIATAGNDTEVLKESSRFRPGNGWHTYRVEVRGDAMKLFVDGRLRNSVKSKRFSGARKVGLYSLASALQVKSFKVFGL